MQERKPPFERGGYSQPRDSWFMQEGVKSGRPPTWLCPSESSGITRHPSGNFLQSHARQPPGSVADERVGVDRGQNSTGVFLRTLLFIALTLANVSDLVPLVGG